jgi:hypothetical protein
MRHRVLLPGKGPHLYLFISLIRTCPCPKALAMEVMVTTLPTVVLAVMLLGGLCMLPQP